MNLRTPMLLVAAAILGLGTGCRVETARSLKLRFACERWLEAARVERLDLEARADADSLSWRGVAERYGRAWVALGGTRRLRTRDPDPLQRELGRLARRAALGRATALARAGDLAAARRDFAQLLDAARPFPGTRADAALEWARAEDRAGNWDAALERYEIWLRGIEAGTWPLHRRGLRIPLYVSRRLAERGATTARAAWVARARAAFEAAAARGEHPRRARYAHFELLLDARHWQEARTVLQRARSLDDPAGIDPRLVLAEANLLARGLGRATEALGLVRSLEERSRHTVQERVAAALLVGQIHLDAGRLEEARAAFMQAREMARSGLGRSEAILGLARIEARRDAVDAARRHYAQLREAYPATPAGLLAPLEESAWLRRRGREQEAEAVLREAIDRYRRLIQYYGAEPQALRAAGYLSECWGALGSWERGVAFLDSVASGFATDERGGPLWVRAARLALDQLEDPQRAMRYLEEVRRRYPDSDLAVAVRALQDSLERRLP